MTGLTGWGGRSGCGWWSSGEFGKGAGGAEFAGGDFVEDPFPFSLGDAADGDFAEEVHFLAAAADDEGDGFAGFAFEYQFFEEMVVETSEIDAVYGEDLAAIFEGDVLGRWYTPCEVSRLLPTAGVEECHGEFFILGPNESYHGGVAQGTGE